MMFSKGMYRHIREIVHVAYISGLVVCMAALVSGSGCARRGVVKEPVSIKRWSCDREADEALKRHDYREGIRLHHDFLERNPENALALYHLGYAYGNTGDHEREVRYYEMAVDLGFRDENIFFNLGMAHGELNQIDEAIGDFNKALDINPNSADNHFGLALTYQRGVADELAEEEFLKAIEIDPAHVDARLRLSMLYADKGELGKAAEQLRSILEIDPDHTGAREFLRRIEGE